MERPVHLIAPESFRGPDRAYNPFTASIVCGRMLRGFMRYSTDPARVTCKECKKELRRVR